MDPEDPLTIIYKITFVPMHFRTFRWLLIVLFGFHSAILMTYMIEVLVTFNADLLISYGPSTSILILGVTAIVIASIRIRDSEANAKILLTRLKQIKHDQCSTATRSKIRKMSRLMTAVVVFNTVVLFIANCLWYIPSTAPESGTIFYVVDLSNRLPRQWGTFLVVCFYVSMPVLVFLDVLNANGLVYGAVRETFLLYELNELLLNLDSNKTWESSSPSNLYYQQEIRRNLITCIKYYTELRRFDIQINSRLYKSLIVIIAEAFLISLSLISTITLGDAHFGYHNAIVAGAGVIGIVFSVFYAGQKLREESERSFQELCHRPWMNWNAQNRKIFLIFLMLSQKPMILGHPNVFICENAFLIKVVQTLGSISMFFYQSVQLKKNQG